MGDIDYTAALALAETLAHLKQQGIVAALVQTEDVRASLDRAGITQQVSASQIYEIVSDAVEALAARPMPAHPPASAYRGI